MTAGEVCTRNVVSVRRDDPVLAVARIMRDRHVGTVVVVDGDGPNRRPIGILTDRDIVVGVVAQAPDKVADLHVSDVFTGELLTISAQDSVDSALQIMRDRGIRRLPVTDHDGRLRGIITFDDLLRIRARQLTELAEVIGRERQREERHRAGAMTT